MGKKSLKTAAEVSAAVDELLGAFGVVTQADAAFQEAPARPSALDAEPKGAAPSAEPDALWSRSRKR